MHYTDNICAGVKYSNPSATPAERNTVTGAAFNIEKNAKNRAYAFILSNNLLERFNEFCQATEGIDMHKYCLNELTD